MAWAAVEINNREKRRRQMFSGEAAELDGEDRSSGVVDIRTIYCHLDIEGFQVITSAVVI
jgi:hypothetical protein